GWWPAPQSDPGLGPVDSSWVPRRRRGTIGPVVSSEPDRTRRILSAGVLVFRWASFAWMTILNLTASEPFRHPTVAWSLVAAAGLFSLWTTVTMSWDRPAVLGVDLVLSLVLVLASGYVVKSGEVVTGRLFFA